jgi:hypothetical protein
VLARVAGRASASGRAQRSPAADAPRESEWKVRRSDLRGLVWFGLVWFGLVWFGFVRFGLARFASVKQSRMVLGAVSLARRSLCLNPKVCA